MDNFSTSEVVHLTAQAKVYRLGALLVAHRLRFPFGIENAQAKIWSKELLFKTQLGYSSFEKKTFVTLPFLVAVVEVRGSSQRDSASDWGPHKDVFN